LLVVIDDHFQEQVGAAHQANDTIGVF
jgi:hypothetical protein